MPALVLSIPYTRFLAGRLRIAICRWIELSAARRPFRLFTLDNDAIGRRVRGVGAYEHEVLAAIEAISSHLTPGVALDIGANIGNHTIVLSRCFARVLAFEPNPVMAAALRANLLLNGCSNVEVIECGLSDRTSIGTLRQQLEGHSGTLEFVEDQSPSGASLERAAVRVERGDEVIANNLGDSERLRMIKIDVEGAELAAMRGLRAHLERDRPVVCFEVRRPEEGDPVRRFLEECGYVYFHAIAATRISIQSLPKVFERSTWRKHYSLCPIDRFEDKHYPAVFASTVSLS